MKRGKINKKAALEMSISTIVVIVIAVTMLILGMVLVRKIMCSGVILTDKISQATENQIAGLFDVGQEGVICMGESGQETKLGGGGRRQIICIINSDNAAKYKFTSVSIECNAATCSGQWSRIKKTFTIPSSDINAPVGKKTVTIATLDVPKDIGKATSVILKVVYTKDAGTTDDKYLILDFVPSSTFSSAVC